MFLDGVGDAASEGIAGGPEAEAAGAVAKLFEGDRLVATEDFEERRVDTVGAAEGDGGGRLRRGEGALLRSGGRRGRAWEGGGAGGVSGHDRIIGSAGAGMSGGIRGAV